MKFSIEDLKTKLRKDAIGDWIVKYKRQTAVGCILVCLLIAAVASQAGKEEKHSNTEDTDSASVLLEDGEVAEAEESNELEQDAYEEINSLIEQYYTYMSEGNLEGLASVVDTVDEEENNRILRSKDLVEGYQNISCYTKKGMEENSYLVFVYYELKFRLIDTPAPGMTPFYVYTNDEGRLVILNGEVSEELKAYVEEVGQHEDVLALRQEVKDKYEEAKAIDSELAKQEERYLRVAAEAEKALETIEEEAVAEETAGETEAEPEEIPETEGTAQNRDTRFTESVRLRSQPSTEAENLGTAYQGEHVTQIESYADGWSKILYNGTECYCKTEFLE